MPNGEKAGRAAPALRPWWLLGLIVAAAIAALLWSLFGTVTQTVSLRGISFPQSGIRRVVAPHGGAVRQTMCAEGDTVEQGDLLAVLPQEALLEQMRGEGGAGDTWREYTDQSLLRAPVNGIISRVAAVGRVLAAGDTVAEIIEDDPFTSQSEVRAYVPADVATLLLEGMEVQVTSASSSRERDGFYSGFISRIGSFPRSAEKISEELSGFQAPWTGDADDNLIEVRVTLVGNVKLDTGALCDMVVITRRVSPFTLLRMT